MGDQNRNGIHSKLLDFLGQRLRRKVATCVSDRLQVVWKRRLENNRTEVASFACNRPNLLCGSGVADMEQSFVAVLDEQRDAGHDMVDADCRDGMDADLHRSAFRQLTKFHYRNVLPGAGDARKVRPNLVVEEELLQSIDHLANAPDIDTLSAFAVEVVRECSECHDMVQMSVGDQDVGDFLLCS